jgi:uncharacterized peroxidase-related enzyme
VWIKVVRPEEATGFLKRVYDEIVEKRGRLSHIMMSQSLRPDVMKAHLDLYLAVMFGAGKLSRAEREMIAVHVSARNRCEYCVAHHAAALEFYLKDRAFVETMARGSLPDSLTDRARAILDFARKLTMNPAAISQEDHRALRMKGLTDEEILEVVLVASYFNFVNRIASALGVSVEEWGPRGYKY